MEETRKPLLLNHKSTDVHTLRDLCYIMAKNVENSLLEAGAKPGEDFTVRDLFNWGMPFALDIFKRSNDSGKNPVEFDNEF